MTSDHLRSTTATGRPLHKDDPIEAWAEAVERIQAASIAQGHEPEPNLTAESLRAQTMLADDIIAEIFEEDALRRRQLEESIPLVVADAVSAWREAELGADIEIVK